jgi:hypothetical protein
MPQDFKMEIYSLIEQLKKDVERHEDIGNPLTENAVAIFREQSGFELPISFSVFLREFGDGAYWLYGHQPIDSTTVTIQPSSPPSKI